MTDFINTCDNISERKLFEIDLVKMKAKSFDETKNMPEWFNLSMHSICQWIVGVFEFRILRMFLRKESDESLTRVTPVMITDFSVYWQSLSEQSKSKIVDRTLEHFKSYHELTFLDNGIDWGQSKLTREFRTLPQTEKMMKLILNLSLLNSNDKSLFFDELKNKMMQLLNSKPVFEILSNAFEVNRDSLFKIENFVFVKFAQIVQMNCFHETFLRDLNEVAKKKVKPPKNSRIKSPVRSTSKKVKTTSNEIAANSRNPSVSDFKKESSLRSEKITQFGKKTNNVNQQTKDQEKSINIEKSQTNQKKNPKTEKKQKIKTDLIDNSPINQKKTQNDTVCEPPVLGTTFLTSLPSKNQPDQKHLSQNLFKKPPDINDKKTISLYNEVLNDANNEKKRTSSTNSQRKAITTFADQRKNEDQFSLSYCHTNSTKEGSRAFKKNSNLPENANNLTEKKKEYSEDEDDYEFDQTTVLKKPKSSEKNDDFQRNKSSEPKQHLFYLKEQELKSNLIKNTIQKPNTKLMAISGVQGSELNKRNVPKDFNIFPNLKKIPKSSAKKMGFEFGGKFIQRDGKLIGNPVLSLFQPPKTQKKFSENIVSLCSISKWAENDVIPTNSTSKIEISHSVQESTNKAEILSTKNSNELNLEKDKQNPNLIFLGHFPFDLPVHSNAVAPRKESIISLPVLKKWDDQPKSIDLNLNEQRNRNLTSASDKTFDPTTKMSIKSNPSVRQSLSNSRLNKIIDLSIENALKNNIELTLEIINNSVKTLKADFTFIKKEIEILIKNAFPSKTFECLEFGSVSTGLVTPFSDLDLGIFFGDIISRSDSHDLLKMLENQIKSHVSVKSYNFISSACVPVLKIIWEKDPTEDKFCADKLILETKIDIIVLLADENNRKSSAIRTTEFVKSCLDKFPLMFSLNLLVKYILNIYKLSNAYQGCLKRRTLFLRFKYSYCPFFGSETSRTISQNRMDFS